MSSDNNNKTLEPMKTDKPLSFYRYSTPCIYVKWNGKSQPIGRFKTAEEAKEAILRIESSMPTKLDLWTIETPENSIKLTP